MFPGWYDMRRIKKWYEHQLEGEVDTIKCNHVVWVRKSVVVEKESKRGIIIIVVVYNCFTTGSGRY